jgi:hypothetical protein
MFYAINHDRQTFCTIKAGSSLEQKLVELNIKKNRLVIVLKNTKFSIFKTEEAARGFLAMLFLHGGQS